MFDRFSDRARQVVALAQQEARALDHRYIGTEHILLGLVREGDGPAATALKSRGVSLEGVRRRVEELIGPGQQAPSGHIPFTPRAKKVLELSLREALQLGHDDVGPEHILLSLIREGEGVAAQVLVELGADLDRVGQQVIQLAGYQGTWTVTVERPASRFERLTYAAREVVHLARDEAMMLGHDHIGTEHILLGLIHEREGVAAKALERHGISLESARQQVEEILAAGQQRPSGHVGFTSRAKMVLDLSLREALRLGHDHIDTEHILLGLIRQGEGVAAHALMRLGADLPRLREEVLALMPQGDTGAGGPGDTDGHG